MNEEWDKLWENLIGYLNHLNNKNLITGWLADIKSVGDAMQSENVQLRKDVKELANMGSEDLRQKIILKKKIGVIQTKLRWLLDNGYFKFCETDIQELLDQ